MSVGEDQKQYMQEGGHRSQMGVCSSREELEGRQEQLAGPGQGAPRTLRSFYFGDAGAFLAAPGGIATSRRGRREAEELDPGRRSSRWWAKHRDSGSTRSVRRSAPRSCSLGVAAGWSCPMSACDRSGCSRQTDGESAPESIPWGQEAGPSRERTWWRGSRLVQV